MFNNCLMCGAPLGTAGTCPNWMLHDMAMAPNVHGPVAMPPAAFQWSPPVPTKPLQRCPVCEGRGVVAWDPASPTTTEHTSSGPWTCPTCKGGRVLDWMGNPCPEHCPAVRP